MRHFTNQTSATLRLCASLFPLFVCCVAADSVRAADKPNVVIIFIDDMGYGDIGPFGNTINKTPNLDRMAKEGLKLTQFYVSNTACTPSRSALMTGTYAHRIGMDGAVVFPGEARGLNPDEITIAELLKTEGYITGCFGKWHLGDQPEFLPLAQGFDHYFGIPYSNDMWPGNKRGNPVTNRGPYEPLPIIRGNKAVAYVSDGADQSLLCEVVTDEAIKFIKDHQDRPFFVYLPHAYVHGPRYARPEILEKAEGDVNRANVEEVDTSVGRVLGTLRELGLDKKTWVLFTSDNGGAGGMSMGPLRGGKGGPKYEGHMREPTLAWWPGTIPPGVETEAIVTTTDLFPSLAKLVGAALPDDRVIDGKDTLDVLLGKPGAQSPHKIHYYEVDGIRRGDWKLVKSRGGRSELYDLNADLGETNNLAAQHPDVVQELEDLLAKHAASIAADVRPAGFVEGAKPIISEPGDLPRLRDYMGVPDTVVGSPKAAAAGPNRIPGRTDVTPAVYKPAADDLLIADFEGDTYGDWRIEGEACGDRPAVAGVSPRNKVTGYLGKGLVNTFLGGDRPIGTLTSPPFKVERKHLNFLIGAGRHAGKTCMNLVIDGKAIRTAVGSARKDSRGREIMDWQSWDVTEFAGKQATLEIVDAHSGGWGHINVDHIFQSNRAMPSSLPAVYRSTAAPPITGTDPLLLEPGQMDSAHRTFASYGDVGYDQKLRPQFHFSSRKNWINDPNGMVYYDGEWHLYFQHCALSVNRGPKSWGHAVSTDMLHWEQLPHAILPYDKGAIWSGTAVVDHNNSLGKQVGDTKTLVAFFTTTWRDGFYQAMAYSTDRGRTYTLYNNGDPVVPNQGVMRGERDPKVFWDEAHEKWKMILILGGKERLIRIFESDNLTDWVKAGDITRKWAAECIDLFPLPVDGDRENMRWVITDASFDYEIGQFTGDGFETEGETLRGDYGKGFYAAQTFNNGPDGRIVQIGWMNDRRAECPFLVEGMPFNQQMAFPTDLTLRTTPDGIRLFRWPVPEIKSLYQKSHTFNDLTIESANEALSELKPELVDLSIEFAPCDDGVVDLTVRGVKITYGNSMKLRTSTGVREVKCFHFNGNSCPAPIIDDKVKLRVLADRASIELYANEGATVASSYEFAMPEDYTLSISANRQVKIHSLVVNKLESIWRSHAELQSRGEQRQ